MAEERVALMPCFSAYSRTSILALGGGGGGGGGGDSAASRSAMRSAGSSRPTDRRTISGGMPALVCASALSSRVHGLRWYSR